MARLLGDIRTFFPSSVVQVMQQEALKRLHLTQMLFEKEMLENVEPDVGRQRRFDTKKVTSFFKTSSHEAAAICKEHHYH